MRVIQEGKEAGPGRRLPRRRDDDRRRGRLPSHRPRARRLGHARPPDRRRADDLRPAAPRLTPRAVGRRAPGRRTRSSSRRRSRRMGGVDKLFAPIAGRPLLAADGHRRGARARADRGRHRRRGATPVGRRSWLPPGVTGVVVGEERRRDRSPRASPRSRALAPDDRDRVVLVHDGARPLVTRLLVGGRRGRRRPRRGDPGPHRSSRP